LQHSVTDVGSDKFMIFVMLWNRWDQI
jgi:hypothetical protein